MLTNLKDMKARLSAYVDLAASGEDVVVTVHGKPRVRLSRIEVEPSAHDLSAWGDRLEKARARYTVSKTKVPGSEQDLWGALREDRL